MNSQNTENKKARAPMTKFWTPGALKRKGGTSSDRTDAAKIQRITAAELKDSSDVETVVTPLTDHRVSALDCESADDVSCLQIPEEESSDVTSDAELSDSNCKSSDDTNDVELSDSDCDSDVPKTNAKFSVDRNGTHWVRLGKMALMSPGRHPSVGPHLRQVCEKIFKKALLAGIIRVPVCESPTSRELAVQDLPTSSLPIICVLHSDETFSKMDYKIGMSGNIRTRYEKKELKRCHILCSSGWITKNLDQEFIELMDEFIGLLNGCSNVPDALKALFKIYKEGGADLGMMSNVYMQLLETSCQLYFKRPGPAEFLTCDEEILTSRRKRAFAIANYLTPIVLAHWKVDGKVVHRASKDNTHCTSSWNTGAHGDRLSSLKVATAYVSDNAPWENSVPDAVFPNGNGADEIFSVDFTPEQRRNGRKIVKSNLEKCTKETRVEFLDTNNNVFGNKHTLENLMKKMKFVCIGRIVSTTKKDSLAKIFIHSKTNSVVFLHAPLGIGMDSRDFISLAASLERLQCCDIMKLIYKGLRTGQERLALEDLPPPDKDATFAGYVLESITKFFHQNKRVGCAAARHVLSDENTNALKQNALKKRTEKTSGVCQAARRAHERVDPNKARAVDRCVVQRAVNLMSTHTLKPDHGAFRISADEMDMLSLERLSIMVNDLFSVGADGRLDGADKRTRSKNWEAFLKRVNLKQLRDQINDIRISHLKESTGGNPLTPKPFDVKANDEIIAGLVESGAFFWIRGTTPTDLESSVIPAFGSIDLPLFFTRAFKEISNVTDYISQMLASGMKERGKSRSYKKKKQTTKHTRAAVLPEGVKFVRHVKLFVDENGEVLGIGSVRGLHKRHSKNPKAVTGGLTFYLCRFEKKSP